MAEFELFFSDLNEDAQKRLLDFYGYREPKDGNWDIDIEPLLVLTKSVEEDM